ncbi:hypothetical protein B9N43_09095 [Denitratisoma sp. DHT3]|nr:hypothetical protein B9N43_09095 [Denitratisoma sp. DHT3]
MTIDIKQFHRVFFDEVAEHLATLESQLLAMGARAPDFGQLNAVFREVHSIKGSAATFGFADLAQLAHLFENLLDQVRKGRLAWHHDLLDIFLGAGDALKGMLAFHRGEGGAAPETMAATCRQLELLSSSIEGAAVPGCVQNQGDPEGEYGFFVEPVQPAIADLNDAAAAADCMGRDTARAEATMRVGVERVDQMIDLLGELVITQSSLLQAAAILDPIRYERLHSALAQLERNTNDLQAAMLSLRMAPVALAFSRFPRVVRELSRSLGKQAQLKIIGEGTELDKRLIERIVDPLTHLVRNSLDHGIEMPASRIAQGKPAVGSITLHAYHQGGNIVIEVGDDGAGLDRQRILSRAGELGLVVRERMDDQEVWQLIFEPGFSTVDHVTEISGRGIGMDVAKRNIEELGGRLEIETMAGEGTRITLRLPLTLAILDGISVGVGDETFIIPIHGVVESLQASPGMVRHLPGTGHLLQVRGEDLPIISLHEVFGIPSAVQALDQGIAVIVDAGGSQAALFIDALGAQHQVVIKSLTTNYRRVPGVAAATIMGDGRVAMILDVAALVAMARARSPLSAAA